LQQPTMESFFSLCSLLVHAECGGGGGYGATYTLYVIFYEAILTFEGIFYHS
jgi:hypothetical protein